MVNKKLFIFISYAALMCVAFATAMYAQTTGETKTILPESLFPKGIGGAWKLNEEESDRVSEKIREMLQGKSSALLTSDESAANQQTLPALSISLFHPDTLILAIGEAQEVTINEGYKNVVLTRTVLTNGGVNVYQLQPDANYTVEANWKKDELNIATVSPRGNRMIEKYQTDPDNKKLIVTIRIENAQAQEMIALRRVYDRTILDVFSNSETEIQ